MLQTICKVISVAQGLLATMFLECSIIPCQDVLLNSGKISAGQTRRLPRTELRLQKIRYAIRL